MSSLHQGFRETSQSADTEAAFRWLDGADGHPLVQQIKRLMLAACPIGAGDQVLDVGCGLGHEVRRLAELTGQQGRVVGIDANAVMIAEASRRAAGMALPIAFEVGDAHDVAIPDDTFSVLAFDFDSDHTVVDAPNPVLTRRIAESLDAAVPHPWIGRELFRLFQQAGLRDVRVVPHATCVSGAAGFAIYQQLNRGTIEQATQAGQVTISEADTWWADLERAAATETFFAANLGFITSGYKP